jgi:prepilin-type N-terminal cleavage/methylation domain-containing protein
MKKAFTLAEVLITLGIIGVVAALTIPGLVASYRKQEYVTRLKKGYANLVNGAKLIMASDGVDTLSQTELFQSIIDGGQTVYDATTFESLPETTRLLQKYFNIVKVDADNVSYLYLHGNSSESPSKLVNLRMADGITYHVELYPGDSGEGEFSVNIDVNGVKGPNQYGRDYFCRYMVSTGGRVMVYSSQAYEKTHPGIYWGELDYHCGKRSNLSDVSTSNGYGCAARIMEEGWQMNY